MSFEGMLSPVLLFEFMNGIVLIKVAQLIRGYEMILERTVSRWKEEVHGCTGVRQRTRCAARRHGAQ